MSKKYFLSVIILFGSFVSAIGQTGMITGVVVDSTLNETIVGAKAFIEAKQTGAYTDLDGVFKIPNLPSGKYTVQISFIGFQTKLFSDVTVKDGFTTSLDTIFMSTGDLKVVEIISTKITNSQMAVVVEVKESDAVANGISEEQIKKSQDNTAAEALKRVPGITLVDNRFVMVRGLTERYNNVLLNNSSTPSSESDVKAFSFDIIPSSVIDRMLVYKSASPDLPGEFAGGVIKIYTKSIPDKDFVNIGFSLSYRGQTTYQPFLEQQAGKYSWLGYDDGTYKLPSGLPADIGKVTNTEEIEKYNSYFNNTWLATEGMALPDKRFSFSMGKKGQLGKKNRDFGSITSITYANTRAVTTSTRELKYPEIESTSPIFRFNESNYNHTVRIGLLQNFSLRLNKQNTIQFKNLYNHIGQNQLLYRDGYWDDILANMHDYTLSNQFRGIFSSQLMGEHDFGTTLKLDWILSYSNTRKNEPDTRRYRQIRNAEAADDAPYYNQITYSTAASVVNPFTLGRLYSETNEDMKVGGFNLSYEPVFEKFPDFTPKLKVGTYFERKDRDFYVRNFGFNTQNIALQSESLTDLFSDENFQDHATGLNIGEDTRPDYKYTAYNQLLANYISLTLPFKKLNIIGGVRVEDNTQHLESLSLDVNPDGSFKQIIVDNPIVSVLPSINANYNFSEKSLVRAGYSKTINRPEFREISPLAYFDFNLFVVNEGNPDLKTPTIQNYDLRYEYYPTPGELLSIGAFYKSFKDPIESYFLIATNPSFSYLNAISAESYGVEAEVRKNLASVFNDRRIVKDIDVIFNGALIKSQVELAATLQDQATERPMFGQSPYILNTSLQYNNDTTNLSIAITHNIIGRRLFLVGNIDRPDVYQMPRHQIDLTVTKTFRENLEFKAGVSDMLNATAYFIQDYNKDGKFETSGTTDSIFMSQRRGAYFTFGITVKL
jgi:TonB-dependent receptor